MKSISNLTHELQTLSKAVQHKNLSTAAVHVGLSQPQLSRLVQKLESELKVVLLDRSSRRKSGWTPVAVELSGAFHRGLGRLEAEIQSVTRAAEIDELRIGTLEGLSTIASRFAEKFFRHLDLKRIDLDVLEYRDLDSLFLSGQLDLILTARSPSRQKFKYLCEVGFQSLEKISTSKEYLVLSPFEWVQMPKAEVDPSSKVFVTNSLALRSRWLKEVGGTGTLPGEARQGRGKGHYTVSMIGHDLLTPSLWEKIIDVVEI